MTQLPINYLSNIGNYSMAINICGQREVNSCKKGK